MRNAVRALLALVAMAGQAQAQEPRVYLYMVIVAPWAPPSDQRSLYYWRDDTFGSVEECAEMAPLLVDRFVEAAQKRRIPPIIIERVHCYDPRRDQTVS